MADTDRELLELAAVAAGLTEVLYGELSGDEPVLWIPGYGTWNPLGEDGDEARLEAALGMDVAWGDVIVIISVPGMARCFERFDSHGGDKQAARRRAGVRAAAEIGRQMRGQHG